MFARRGREGFNARLAPGVTLGLPQTTSSLALRDRRTGHHFSIGGHDDCDQTVRLGVEAGRYVPILFGGVVTETRPKAPAIRRNTADRAVDHPP